MKLLTLVVFSLSLSAHAVELKSAQQLYRSLSQNFPDSVESIGGLSTMIDFQEVICAQSRQAVGMKYGCYGRIGSQASVAQDQNSGLAKGLYMAMKKSGADKDTTSEPGTIYLSFNDLNCARLECKSSQPEDCEGVKVEYKCSAK